MNKRRPKQHFVYRIVVFTMLLCLCLGRGGQTVAQPTLQLISHNVTERCPEVGKHYAATVKINGGEPFTSATDPAAPPYFYYAITRDEVTEVDKNSIAAELPQGTEKEFELKRGVSLLWIFDKNYTAYSFQLADYIKDGSGNLLSIPEVVEPNMNNVVVDSVLCNGGHSGIISVREPGNNVRYILFETQEGSDPKVQAPTDVVKGVNGKGVFKGLAAGIYKLWVEDANQCISSYPSLLTMYEPEQGTVDKTFKGEEKLRCPGDLVEQVKLTPKGGSGKFLRYTWKYSDVAGMAHPAVVTTKPTLDSVMPGNWTVTVIDSKGCEFTESMLVPGIPGYALKIPPTVIEPAACERYNENEEISKGKISNITIVGGKTESRNYVWGEVPAVVKELTGQKVNVGSATPYELPHGDYQILISEGGCVTNFSFNMPYDDTDQPKMEMVGIPPVVCYGTEVKFRLNLKNASLLKTNGLTKYVFRVLHDLDGEKVVTGRVLGMGDRINHRIESRIYDRTSVAVSGISQKGCIVSDIKEIRVIPPVSFAYDVNVSHAGLLFNGKTIDSVRSRNLGKEDQLIRYKDSLALGVLEGTKTEVGFLIAGEADRVTLDIRPTGILTPSRSGKAYLYDLRLPEDVFTNELYKVVTVSRNGYTYDFLRLSTNLIYTMQKEKQTCVTERYIYIRLVDKLRIPNVFTPNGDGINDRWLYNGDETNVNLYSHLQDLLPNLEVEVFTRAGVSVWYAKGNGIGQGWDGTHASTPLPTGTYYYVIRFNASGGGKKWKPVSGSVTIVR